MPILLAETWVYSIAPGDTAELELDRTLILKNMSLQAKVADDGDHTALEVSYTPVGGEIPKSAILATFFKNRTDSVNVQFKIYPGRVYCLTVIGKKYIDHPHPGSTVSSFDHAIPSSALNLIGDLSEHVVLATTPMDMKPIIKVERTATPVEKPQVKPKLKQRAKATREQADKATAEDSDTAGEDETRKSKAKARQPQVLRRTESTGSITRAQSKKLTGVKPASNDSEGPVAGSSGPKRATSSAEAAAKKRKLNASTANPTPEPTVAKQAGGNRTKVKV